MTTAPRSRRPGAGATTLDVPVRIFGAQRCGAGSLSAVLTYYGDPISIEALDAELPRAPGGGVVSVDLLLAARALGYDASWVTGDEERLMRLVQGGRPGILMLRVLDAPGRKADYYHYVVVDGVDPRRRLFRFQFGDGKARWSRMGRGLRRAWRGAGHALLVVGPRPGQDPDLRRALELEASGRLDDAARAYREILRRDPAQLRAWTNLGNVLARQDRTEEAESCYRRALDLDGDDPAALNNLAWLLLERGVLDEAEVLAVRASEQEHDRRDRVLDTLARIQLAQGRCAEAAATFRRALGWTPAASPPDRAELLRGLARAQRDCGDVRGARDILERALGAGPDAPTAEAIRRDLAALPLGP